MSLYVRVYHGFYTHRKTARLRAKIGTDALWLPPRLWAYAAEQQPDGVFQSYSPEELAAVLGYSGNAQAMLEAMLQAGFMDTDPLRIHDWEEYNAYHKEYADRASKAARAKWDKVRSKRESDGCSFSTTPEKEMDIDKDKETSIASRMLEASPLCLQFPSHLNTPAFQKAWAEWVEHARSKNKKVRPQTLQKQIDHKLGPLSEAEAIEMINHSIAGNYQGLFPPNNSGSRRPPAPSRSENQKGGF